MVKDVRFKWKDELRQTCDVPRAAREFGCYMVDRRIYKTGGTCTERNAGLAAGMGVSARSVQRYVRVLVERGWIVVDRVTDSKRSIRLRYPWQENEVPKHDSFGTVAATKLSADCDKLVTPYKKDNNVSNNEQSNRREIAFATIQIQKSDEGPLDSWEDLV